LNNIQPEKGCEKRTLRHLQFKDFFASKRIGGKITSPPEKKKISFFKLRREFQQEIHKERESTLLKFG